MCAHCPVCQAQNTASYKAPGNSEFYPICEHPLESVSIDVPSMQALKVNQLSTKGPTSTPFDTSGYIVAAPTTKEELAGQRAAELLYHNWFTVCGHLRELMSDKGSAFVSSWFKTLCHLQGVHKAQSRAYFSRSNERADYSTSWRSSIGRARSIGTRDSLECNKLVPGGGSATRSLSKLPTREESPKGPTPSQVYDPSS